MFHQKKTTLLIVQPNRTAIKNSKVTISTVIPHTEWHGTLPVYPMVDPSVRLSGPLLKGTNGTFLGSHIIYHGGTLKDFG